MNPLAAVPVGALLLGGLGLIVAALFGALPPLVLRGPSHDMADVGRRAALAGVAFVVGLAVTGWPVAAVYLAAGGAAVPVLAGSKRERQAAIDKAEALATWAESLRDMMAAGAGLRETLRASARVAPSPIAEDVRRLAYRLQHEAVDVALAKFSTDVADPTADIIVVALTLANRGQAGRLQDVLSTVAAAGRDAASMRQRIEGTRQRSYTQSRIVVATSAVFIAFLVVFRREFLEPYDSVGGQVALAVIGAMFAVSGYGLYQLGRPPVPVRPFGRIERLRRATGQVLVR